MKPSKNSEPAKTIGSYLKDKGHPVPHTLILEALARADGFNNRHQARAEESANAAVPVLPARIFVASVEHSHGTDMWTNMSEAGAFASIVEYVRENWSQELGERSMDGLTDEALVETYFDHMGDQGTRREFYSVEGYPLQGSTTPIAPASLDVKRPEFASDGVSLHETLAAMLDSASLGDEHRSNIDKIRSAIKDQKGYTPLWLASHLLEEHGMQIIVTCSVDDIEESLKGTLDEGQTMPNRKLIASAIRHFSNKSGISSDATDAMLDSIQRTAITWQNEDE